MTRTLRLMTALNLTLALVWCLDRRPLALCFSSAAALLSLLAAEGSATLDRAADRD